MLTIKRTLWWAIVQVVLSACTSTDPVRVEEDFGNSVRNMIQAQTYNPDAARNPPSEPPTVLDGPKGSKVLDTYRGDVSDPQKTERPIQLDIIR